MTFTEHDWADILDPRDWPEDYRQRRAIHDAEQRAEAARVGNGSAHDAGEEWEDPPPDDDVVRHFRRLPIDLTTPLEPPAMLDDWLYAGRLTVLQSEPGVGKTWLATWQLMRAMEAGHHCIYLDEEGGPDLVHERLSSLGADPAIVAERLWYYAFEGRRWHDDDLAAFDAMLGRVGRPLGLAVLDSLPDFLSAAALSEDSSTDVTGFIAKVCGRLRAAGCAQLLLDHLTKAPADGTRKRSRYSRGSGAKLAKADTTLLLEVISEFDATTSGVLSVCKTKDRRGRIDLPTLSKPARHIAVNVADGQVAFEVQQARAVGEDLPRWDGPTHCMEAVHHLLEQHPHEEMTFRTIATRLRAAGNSYRDTTIREALERLALEGRAGVRAGPRGSLLYRFSEAGEAEPEERLADF